MYLSGAVVRAWSMRRLLLRGFGKILKNVPLPVASGRGREEVNCSGGRLIDREEANPYPLQTNDYFTHI